MKFDLFHPDVIENPRRIYANLHEQDGVLLGSPPMPEFPECWYVTGYSEALQVLKSPVFVHDRGKVSGLPPLANFSGEALQFWKQTTEWPLFLDAPEHTARRQLMANFFKEAFVLDLAQFIEQKSQVLLDEALAKPSFDVMWDFAYPLTLNVICRLVGIQLPELHWFKSHTRKLANTLDLRSGLHDYQPSLQATDELNDFFHEQIRQSTSQNGLLGYLLGKGLSEEELLPLLLQIIFAGQETTADAIGLGVKTLAKHPNTRRQLIGNPHLMESTVREILRYESTLQFSGIRTATEPIRIGGKQVAHGDCILIAIGACNHDSRHFNDPQQFDIMRNNTGPELSFGHGIHYCLGVHLARLEMRIALQALLERLPTKWRIEHCEMRQNRVFRGPSTLTLGF